MEAGVNRMIMNVSMSNTEELTVTQSQDSMNGPRKLTKEDLMVVRYQDGQATFEDILPLFSGSIKKLSNRYVPGYTFEDKYQELCLKLFTSLNKWDRNGTCSFNTYLNFAMINYLNWRIRKANTDRKKANSDAIKVSMEVQADLERETETGMSFEDPEFLRIELIYGIPLSDLESSCVNLLAQGYKATEVARRLGITSSKLRAIKIGLRPKFEFLLETN